MLLFALVASDSDFIVELYPSREEAEAALRQVLEDEPEFASLLSVQPLDFAAVRWSRSRN